MSFGFFRANNSKTYKTWSFETQIPSGLTFSPELVLLGNDRVTWEFGDGLLRAGNNPSYIFPNSSRKKVTVRTNSLNNVRSINLRPLGVEARIVGNIDFTGMNSLNSLFIGNNFINSSLTAITNSQSSAAYTGYDVSRLNILGNLDLRNVVLGGTIPPFGFNNGFSCRFNPNLTSITHTAATNTLSGYNASNCNLTGTHDVSMLPNCVVNFQCAGNPNLTKIIHSSASTIGPSPFGYFAGGNNLTGHLDFTPLVGHLTSGYQFIDIGFNSNLTGVTIPYSNRAMSQYILYYCNITGTHDVSKLTNLGGQFRMEYNPNLTSIIHTASTNTFSEYSVSNCNLTGTHDISMLNGLTNFSLSNNPLLTNILLPVTTKTMNGMITTNCDLGYIDFYPLSGATIKNSTIWLQNNNMTVSEVNHILYDFDYLATSNPFTWSGVTLAIGDNNAYPDSSSGGYDGLSAVNNLTGTSKWVITL